MYVVKLQKSLLFHKAMHNGPAPHLFHTILPDGMENQLSIAKPYLFPPFPSRHWSLLSSAPKSNEPENFLMFYGNRLW